MAEEKSGTTLTERSYLPEIIYLVKERRQIVFIMAAMMGVGTLINHLLYIPVFIASAHLETVNAKDNFLSRLSEAESLGVAKYAMDSSQEVQRHIYRLKSGSFYEKVAKELIESPEYPKLNLTRPSELSVFQRKFWKTRFQKALNRKPIENKEIIRPGDKDRLIGLAGVLQEATSISTDGSDSISLSVKTFDAPTSLFLVNLEAETYLKLTLEQERNDLSELQQFMRDRLSDAEQALKRDGQELVNLKNKYGILNVEETGKAFGDQIREIQSKLNVAKLKIEQNNHLIRFYEKKLAEHAEIVLSGKEYSILKDDPESLSSQLESLKRQKSLYQAEGKSETNEEVGRVNDDIRKIAEAMLKQKGEDRKYPEEGASLNAAAIQATISQLRGENAIVKTQIAAMERANSKVLKSVTNFPTIEQELLGRNESLKLQYDLYSGLKRKLQDLEIQKLAIRSSIKIDPLFGVAPREVRVSLIFRLPFAILVGAFLGCVVILFLELINGTVRHISDLESMGLSVLGDIPIVKSKLGQSSSGSVFNQELLVCQSRPGSTEAMAFNYVREQIRAALNHKGTSGRSITITGTDLHEGKTFFSVNLAISFARLNKKVILIDGDLYLPGVHSYLGLDNEKGVTSFLESSDTSIEQHLTDCKIKNLDVLLGGVKSAHHMEWVGSERFKHLIEKLSTEYDFVIVDAPSAVNMLDAPVISSMTDVAILVASYRNTKRSTLLAAHKRVFQISHHYAHSVLNGVPPELKQSSRYSSQKEIDV